MARAKVVDDSTEFISKIESMRLQLAGMKKKKRLFKSLSAAEKTHNDHITYFLKALDSRMIGNKNFFIEIDGKVAGLLSMSVPPNGSSSGDRVKIHGLVSHPGAKDVHRLAIEQAVQVSVQQRRNGEVEVILPPRDSFDEEAVDYRALGFIDSSGWKGASMILSPSSAAWLFPQQPPPGYRGSTLGDPLDESDRK